MPLFLTSCCSTVAILASTAAARRCSSRRPPLLLAASATAPRVTCRRSSWRLPSLFMSSSSTSISVIPPFNLLLPPISQPMIDAAFFLHPPPHDFLPPLYTARLSSFIAAA
ncbi:hypothetical protein Fmac_021932 [Flemingia macrophylla]|uniref:Secreted protein n=1 Tax=Flemingia macrophylla TaxID=520843 RepID=A0ABD1M019_9FABA